MSSIDDLKRQALEYHRQHPPGKIKVAPTKALVTQKDLALAYSPGVAAACDAIVADPAEVSTVTARGNLVAVISNGTAVLGLGNIGPLAAKPVMEGKGVLFQKFAGIDVFDIEIDEHDPDKLVDIIAALEGLNRFSSILARDKDNLGRALDTLPDALRVLNKNRNDIVDAFAALKRLAMVTSRVLSQTKVDFAADLKDAYSVVKELNDSRKNFVTSLQILLTFPFPNFGIKQAVRGDYLNVFTTFDLTLRRLGETFFTTS